MIESQRKNRICKKKLLNQYFQTMRKMAYEL